MFAKGAERPEIRVKVEYQFGPSMPNMVSTAFVRSTQA